MKEIREKRMECSRCCGDEDDRGVSGSRREKGIIRGCTVMGSSLERH